MKKKRPVNLELNTITLPIMGVASILHRISAVIIWVAAVFCLPALYISLESPEGFYRIKGMITEVFVIQFLVWGFLTAMGYYAAGGLKHIIQECGYFEELEGGRLISRVAIGLGVALSVLFGVWVWA